MTEATAPPGIDAGREGLSFDAVYEAHFGFVWQTAARLGVPRSALDDATQEVFVVVHRRLAECSDASTLRRWLYAIVLNVARTFRRAAMRQPLAIEEGDPPPAASTPGPDAHHERAEKLEVLQSILATMEEEKLEVFVLVELEELSVPEVARLLGIKLNNAYKRLRASRQDFHAAAARYRARTARSAP